ncbi:DNA sulfur modification protein DndB [Robertmurraya massiliosenegalensis]
MTTQIKIKDLLTVYRIDSTVNRDINHVRLPKIMNYVNSYDSYPGIFFPSIMCVYSGNPIQDFNVNRLELVVPEESHLIVIDGQHRIKSLESFINSKKIAAERKEKVLNSDLTLQLYFGLSQDDMKNLFADINSNSVKVSMSLVTAYDTREVLNILVQELYEVSSSLQSLGIEFSKSKLMRPKNINFITSVRLKKFISLLLFNKKQLSLKEEKHIKNHYDQILSFLERFFYFFTSFLPNNPGDVLKYVLGHEAVQNALAISLHKQIIDYSDELNWAMDWEDKIENIINIDWSVNNSEWNSLLIKARANTASEFYSIDIKDEKNVTDRIQYLLNH